MSFSKACLFAGLLFTLLFTACGKPENNRPGTTVMQRGELVVAMDIEMPGYFVLGGESYGYQYDLLTAYADYLGVELRVVSDNTPSSYEAMLAAGDVDLVATLSNHIDPAERGRAIPVYNTSYVMLTGKVRAAQLRKNGDREPLSFLDGTKLLVSAGFKGSKIYDALLDSLSNTEIYISSRNSFELMELLADGEYDYLICEQSEAQLGCALVRNVEQIYHFDEQISLSAVVSPRETELKNDFQAWLIHFRNGEEYAVLNDLYFKKGIVRQVLGQRLTARSGSGSISPFDHVIKSASEKEGYDWRLISAIVYSESRFDPHVISKRGARGLMQIMPHVARQFAEAGEDIMDPENNVLLGLKILGKIEKSLKFSSGTPKSERMKIVLACYNGGIGHVLDARNLAAKYDANPDSWADVSKYLTLKATPEYATDAVVKCGSFKGGSETLAFVDQVFTRYSSYCDNVKL